jgi:hypothetical protein
MKRSIEIGLISRKILKWFFVYAVVFIGLLKPTHIFSGENKYKDAEALARAFLTYRTVYYEGAISARQLVNNSWINVRMHFVMDTSLRITNLSINDIVIPLPKPLFGLPVSDNGYQNFIMNLVSRDVDGEVSGTGSFSSRLLTADDLIIVTVVPKFPPVFIPVKITDRESIQLIMTGTDNWATSYDPVRQGFLVYVLDGSTSAEYQIATFDGLILSRGLLVPFHDVLPYTNLTVNLRLAGNIVEVRFGDLSYANFPGQRFDSTVIRDGEIIPAKVFAIQDIDNSFLYTWITGLPGTSIEIRDKDGVVVPATIKDYGSGVEIITKDIIDRAIVTALPCCLTNQSKAFSIYFGRL